MPHRQLEHHEHQDSGFHYPISLLLDNIKSPANVGSIFRIADALGVSEIFLCGNTAKPPNDKIRKSSRNTERHVKYSHHLNAETLSRQLLNRGDLLVALEICSDSIDIRRFSQQFYGKPAPICLILGSEKHGVDQKLLQLCQHSTHIKMLGHNSSMNVANACAIAVFELSRLYEKARED